jgi:adenine phosphoribosyltransferase
MNDDLKLLIRTIADYPKPGIQFRDITTLLLDGPGFGAAIDRMAAAVREPPALVAGIEARGFIFGAALVAGINYALEYGEDRIEMHSDAVAPGARVLLVDDLIATGGTALAGVELLRGAGAHVVGASFVIDLPALGGAARLRASGVAVDTLVEFEGE